MFIIHFNKTPFGLIFLLICQNKKGSSIAFHLLCFFFAWDLSYFGSDTNTRVCRQTWQQSFCLLMLYCSHISKGFTSHLLLNVYTFTLNFLCRFYLCFGCLLTDIYLRLDNKMKYKYLFGENFGSSYVSKDFYFNIVCVCFMMVEIDKQLFFQCNFSSGIIVLCLLNKCLPKAFHVLPMNNFVSFDNKKN